MKDPTEAVANGYLMAGCYSSEHLTRNLHVLQPHVQFLQHTSAHICVNLNSRCRGSTHTARGLTVPQPRGRAGRKCKEMEGWITLYLYLQPQRAQPKISQLRDYIPGVQVSLVPRQLIDKYIYKSKTLTASLELVRFSNLYESDVFHSEDLHLYHYFSFQTNLIACPR